MLTLWNPRGATAFRPGSADADEDAAEIEADQHARSLT